MTDENLTADQVQAEGQAADYWYRRWLHWRWRSDYWRRKVSVCAVVSASGPNGEPVACAYKPEHEGRHSWATLGTVEPVVNAARRVELECWPTASPAALDAIAELHAALEAFDT